ncbi:MAG TPA: TlpA family protein disulfide reductase [Chloroflexi bacterium]|nr:TlpA family protein disulfide reductase [Chloroflexota bacterium]
MNKSPSRSQRWLAFTIPLVAIGLVAAFLWLVRSSADGRSSPAAVQAGYVAATSVAPVLVTPAHEAASLPLPVPHTPTPAIASAATDVAATDVAATDAAATDAAATDAAATDAAATDDIVAVVGGIALLRQELETTLAIERVMAGLTGQPPASPDSVLEQWINTELVLQRSGAPLDPEKAATALDAILARYGHAHSALLNALAAANIAETAFNTYFARLVAADAYLRAQIAATGLPAANLIKAWQREAQISFGPVANAILGTAVASPQASPSVPVATAPTQGAAATATPAAVMDAAAMLDPDAPRGTEIGQIAPDFALPTVGSNDSQYTLHNLLGGPTVLIFWTTWCPYCLRQTPVLVAAHRQWGEEIQFVGVNVAEDVGVVTPYIAEHAIDYPILLDRDSVTAGAYAVQGYPTTYFLDNSARIVARHVGALTEEQLNSYLQMLRPVE